ncbi:MAG: cytochrome c [Woeseiaceae bacterium]|nr:cytochrome c [Woeseiaceae bacterium]
MSGPTLRTLFLAATLAFSAHAIADDDPRIERQDLMKSVREAAKPVGQMMRGDMDFDADTLMSSLETWLDVSTKFGGLFPPGSESGEETEAAPAIWTDREGFDKALAEWQTATQAAIDAKPASLEEARPIVGPVFNTCKGCHDNYRIEEE